MGFSVEQGGGANESLYTLGDVESGISSCILGDGVLVLLIGLARFNSSARVSNALRAGSPIGSESVVGEGGFVKI